MRASVRLAAPSQVELPQIQTPARPRKSHPERFRPQKRVAQQFLGAGEPGRAVAALAERVLAFRANECGHRRPGSLAGPPRRQSSYAGSFQSSQVQSARPMMSSLSFADSHGSSSVNIVTHWRHETGMRVMSVPQNIRSGPKAS